MGRVTLPNSDLVILQDLITHMMFTDTSQWEQYMQILTVMCGVHSVLTSMSTPYSTHRLGSLHVMYVLVKPHVCNNTISNAQSNLQ